MASQAGGSSQISAAASAEDSLDRADRVSTNERAPTGPAMSSNAAGEEESADEDDGDDVEAELGDAGGPSSSSPAVGTSTGSSNSAPVPSSKKKKKKKGKAKASAVDQSSAGHGALSKLRSVLGKDKGASDGTGPAADSTPSGPSSSSSRKQGVSDELYERILAEARKNVGEEQAKKLDRQTVAEMIETLKLRDVMTGKSSGIDSTGRNKKDMSDYKFWSSQPVPKLGSLTNITPDGPIEKDKPSEEIKQEPYPLPKDFEWVTMDLGDPVQLKEVYELLTHNYVEDEQATFRFDYHAEFIRWALQSPGYIQDWHIGVRVSASRRLVAFISGVPITLRIRQTVKRVSEINFLCVHKKLRNKRLAPVLIKEVTRRCNLVGIFQAIYTAGIYLPTPVSACQYYHRALNTKKLVETGFSGVPRNTTLARLILKNRVGDKTSIPGLREVQHKDLRQVGELLKAYLARFDMAPVMDDEEVDHMFWSGRGSGQTDPQTGRRDGQVTWTYVVEDPESGRITDFFSLYVLPSTAIQMEPQQTINAAYLSYYATNQCPACRLLLPHGDSQGTSQVITWDRESPEDRKALKARLNLLIGDALVIANQAKFDVCNALTLQDNNLFLEDQKFGAGDGTLYYYLFNYNSRPIAGGTVEPAAAAAGQRRLGKNQPSGGFIPEKGSGVGVVML